MAGMPSRGIMLPFTPAILPLYPLGFFALLRFCDGSMSASLLGAFGSIPVGDHYVRVEAVCVAVVALWNFASALTSARSYQLSPDPYGQVWKWDPSHAQLALACLLSPLHALLILFWSCTVHPYSGGKAVQGPPLYVLFWATLHGLLSLLLADRFFRRESAQFAIDNGIYAAEVEERNTKMLEQRKAEMDYFNKFHQS
mmetsp:Transcript_27747/g.65384  ORF Transcript_27747/g.65384 Transcript_27747/m.65384 type:complete len:198 (+) Transcript_27747:23-616(+)